MGLFSSRLFKKIKCRLISRLLVIKLATDEDCENIYNWRNHELNRKYSLNSEIIPWEIHQNWFKTKIRDSDSRVLIVKYLMQEVGVVIFNFEDQNSEISIYLVPGFHNKGFGLSVLYLAERWLRANHVIKNINAKIIPKNYASISVFSEAGYLFINSEDDYQLWQRSLSNTK